MRWTEARASCARSPDRASVTVMAQPLATSDQLWIELMKSTIEAQTPAERAAIKSRAVSFARDLAEVEPARPLTQTARKAS